MLKLTQLPQDFTATLKAMHTAEKLVFHYKRLSFDVAVTVAEEQTSANDGGSVGSISVSSANSNSSQNSSVSRIQFEVPVLLPITGK